MTTREWRFPSSGDQDRRLMPQAPATPILLRPPARWWGYALTIAAGALTNLAWSLSAIIALQALGGEISPVADLDFFETWRDLAFLWPAVGVEELIFRAPLALPVAFGVERLVAPMMAILSVLFGFAHGASLAHVVIQGGGGLILSFVFLRCGGLHHHAIRGWVCATAAHGLYDSALWLVGYVALATGA
jgi:hypothetical protein